MTKLNISQFIELNSIKMGSITNAKGFLGIFDEKICKYLSNNMSNSTLGIASGKSVIHNFFNTNQLFKKGEFNGGIIAALKSYSFNFESSNNGISSVLQKSKIYFKVDKEKLQDHCLQRSFNVNPTQINKGNINFSQKDSVVLGKISIEDLKKLLKSK